MENPVSTRTMPMVMHHLFYAVVILSFFFFYFSTLKVSHTSENKASFI